MSRQKAHASLKLPAGMFGAPVQLERFILSQLLLKRSRKPLLESKLFKTDLPRERKTEKSKGRR